MSLTRNLTASSCLLLCAVIVPVSFCQTGPMPPRLPRRADHRPRNLRHPNPQRPIHRHHRDPLPRTPPRRVRPTLTPPPRTSPAPPRAASITSAVNSSQRTSAATPRSSPPTSTIPPAASTSSTTPSSASPARLFSPGPPRRPTNTIPYRTPPNNPNFKQEDIGTQPLDGLTLTGIRKSRDHPRRRSAAPAKHRHRRRVLVLSRPLHLHDHQTQRPTYRRADRRRHQRRPPRPEASTLRRPRHLQNRRRKSPRTINFQLIRAQ